jgi:SAM-dependent methyltransferase
LSGEVDPRWYSGFFDREWLEHGMAFFPPEKTLLEVDFVLEALELDAGARVLDVACGHGRHALELARRGYRVTGVDLSEPSLALARDAASAEGLEIDFLHADMRDLPFAGEFDAAVNLFTSFGYLESEEEDERAVAAMAGALRSGGRLFLETIDAVALLRLYRPQTWQELEDGTLMVEERGYDFLTGRNNVTWTFVRSDGRRSELRHSLRLYTPAEIARMLRQAGLDVERAWGSWDGAELSLDTTRGIRLLVLGRKS